MNFSSEHYIDILIENNYKLSDFIKWLQSTKQLYNTIQMFNYLFSAMNKNINELLFYKDSIYINMNIFDIIKLENKNDDKNLINKNKMPIESSIIWSIRKVYLYIQFLINYNTDIDKTKSKKDHITDAYMNIYYPYHRNVTRNIFISNFKLLDTVKNNIIDEILEKNKDYINKCKIVCEKITKFYETKIKLPDDLNISYM